MSFYCHTEPYFFMLDEADKSWRVEFADVKKAPPLVPGCRVKVRGMFPKWATTPRMRGASVAVTGKASVPPYIELTPEEMYATDADGEPGRRSWYGRLVSTSGVIRDINRRETYTQIVIGSKEMPVLVSVPFKLTDPLPPEIEIGACVRVRVYIEKGGLNINWLRFYNKKQASEQDLKVLEPDTDPARNHLVNGECEYQGAWQTAALASVNNTKYEWLNCNRYIQNSKGHKPK